MLAGIPAPRLQTGMTMLKTGSVRTDVFFGTDMDRHGQTAPSLQTARQGAQVLSCTALVHCPKTHGGQFRPDPARKCRRPWGGQLRYLCSVSNDAGYGPGFPGALERVAFDWMKSFSRQTEAAFAFANALKQPAEFN